MEQQNKNKQVKLKRWLIFCEPCGKKEIITEGLENDLVSIPLADVPGGAPKLDPATKKVTERKATPRNKAFKCPHCGRGVVSKALPEVYAKTIREREELLEKENYEREREQRIRDGLLPEKPQFDPKLEIQKRKAP